MGEFREHLNLEVNPVSNDRFEILAITAGVANGWEFPAEVLRESLALWEGVNCFVDHSLSARSVRDIAGVVADVHDDIQRVVEIRAVFRDSVERPAHARRGDHMHRVRDLARLFDAFDMKADIAHVGHVSGPPFSSG